MKAPPPPDLKALPGRSAAPGYHERRCAACRAIMPRYDDVCPECGAKVARRPPSRAFAIVLALVLGGLGVHRLYLGQVGRALIYLLFAWTFLPVLLGWIDAVRYLRMPRGEFALRYG